MRNILSTLLLVCFCVYGQAQLIVTGVCDGPLPGGLPKVVELYVTDDIADLSLYGIGSANNGQGTDGEEFTFPAVSANAGDFICLTSDSTAFADFFGTNADYITGAVLINGDDAIEVFGSGIVIDVFGDINMDGTGTPWDYRDGWAYRNSGTGPDSSTFVEANFMYSGTDVLDNETTNATAATPFPMRSYSRLAPIVADGIWDVNYGMPLCVQDNETGFGDNSDPDPEQANGSELDAAYAVIENGNLCIFLAGNLESNFNKLDLFIDSRPGGQNVLTNDNPNVDFDGLNTMAGLTFDAGFESDFYYTVTCGNAPLEVFASTAQTIGLTGSGAFLGGGVGSMHMLSNGGSVGINNSNIAGVTGSTATGGDSVTTGMELCIPLSAIGNPTGDIHITAFINGSAHDFLSNQVLCGLGGGQANLGAPSGVNFANIAGNQFFTLCGTDGGMVMTDGGATQVITCPGDGIDDIVIATHTTSSTSNYTYVITDENNVILDLPTSDTLNFDGAGVGVCRVWGLSYSGNILAMVGDTASAVALTDVCYELSSNFIEIVRTMPDGGMVMTPDSATTVYTCVGDGNADMVSFAHMTTSAASYAYVITDTAGVILGLPPGNSNDFEGAGAGTCLVWGLSYTGNITAMVGDTATAVALSDECFDLSDNFISVVRTMPDGGMVMTTTGMDTVTTCAGDGISDVVSFMNTSTSSVPYAYVITDPNGVILGLPGGNSQDFDGAGAGTCLVWGLSYTGNVTAAVGDTASMIALSDDCYELSANYITVIRTGVDGGTVMTTDSASTVYTCVGDGTADVVSFMHTTSSSASYAYVITDTDGVILGLPSGNSQDFDGAGAGTCLVWGLSYTGNITAAVGDTATSIALSDGCFALSSNFISVIRDMPMGGTVAMPNGNTERLVCVGDGNPDVVTFTHTTSSNLNYTYVITDDNNMILGLPPGNSQDFDGAGLGVCRVWGLSYAGNITAMVGDDAAAVALADGCFELSSNFIEITRTEPDGGEVESTDGEDEYLICVGDGNPDVISFTHTTTSDASYAYVVTDLDGTILGLPPGNSQDFEGAGTGVCLVWGLSYTGNLTAMVGDDATVVDLSDECYELSDNFITVVRDEPEGGMVQTDSGQTVLTLCTDDGIADSYTFETDSDSEFDYAFVVTDDNNVILDIPQGNVVDFEGAPAGTCRVWGLSFTGEVIAEAGDDAAAVDLTDGCFELSDNFVEVVRDTACAPTGLNDNDFPASEITLAPVPANDKVNISFVTSGSIAPVTNITVFDYAGKVVFQSSYNTTQGENIITLGLEGYASGLYFISLENNGQFANRKFVKN